MLPGLGFSEVLVLGVIALLVVGPKDLPLMLRKLGRQMARLRGLAAEFRTGFDELARQAELDELKKEVEALRRGQIFSDAEMEQMRVLEPLPAPAAFDAGPPAPSPADGGETIESAPDPAGNAGEGAGGPEFPAVAPEPARVST
ncbi:MAG: sec-independent protein translocase protein TatB [Alphaproteobacteria bacterium]|nr:MAG: sec-independent protein translocase protein TatB [Caulobacteraceae bacterium]TPW07039.1 MAG: sec-independent protein translocase protein TatB [Alphaproteobacteria bacterium]